MEIIGVLLFLWTFDFIVFSLLVELVFQIIDFSLQLLNCNSKFCQVLISYINLLLKISHLFLQLLVLFANFFISLSQLIKALGFSMQFGKCRVQFLNVLIQ